MIRTLILILFFTSLNFAHGYSYFYYNSKNINISNRSFNNYIRPQVRNLVHDFYSVLKKINPLQEEIVNLKSLNQRFAIYWKKFTPSCQEESCQENYEDLKSLAQKIHRKTLKLENSITKLYSRKKNINSTILLSKESGEIADTWHNILNYLENPLLVKEKKQVSIYLKQVSLSIEIILTKPLDEDLQKDFYFVWANFIKKLEREVLKKQNIKFLVTRLEELNIIWNSFYMKVPRWKNINSKHQLKIMHRRWNSILKIVLVR